MNISYHDKISRLSKKVPRGPIKTNVTLRTRNYLKFSTVIGFQGRFWPIPESPLPFNYLGEIAFLEISSKVYVVRFSCRIYE